VIGRQDAHPAHGPGRHGTEPPAPGGDHESRGRPPGYGVQEGRHSGEFPQVGVRHAEQSGNRWPVQNDAAPGRHGGDDWPRQETGPNHAAPNHAGPSHAGPNHAGPNHAGPNHAGPSHAEPNHAEGSHSGPSHAEPGHGGASHAGPGHGGASHAGPGHGGASHAGPGHAGAGHAGSGHAGSGHAGADHAGPGHARINHADADHAGPHYAEGGQAGPNTPYGYSADPRYSNHRPDERFPDAGRHTDYSAADRYSNYREDERFGEYQPAGDDRFGVARHAEVRAQGWDVAGHDTHVSGDIHAERAEVWETSSRLRQPAWLANPDHAAETEDDGRHSRQGDRPPRHG
jgi:hypothetical protein